MTQDEGKTQNNASEGDAPVRPTATQILQGRDDGVFRPGRLSEPASSFASFAVDSDDEEDDKDVEDQDKSNNQGEQEGYEPDPWDDHSQASESESSVSSAEAREAAIRDGFLGFLYDKVLNDLFQRFLAIVMPYVQMVIDFIKRCLRMESDTDQDEAEEVLEAAADTFDADDALSPSLGQSSSHHHHQASRAVQISRVASVAHVLNTTTAQSGTATAGQVATTTSAASTATSQQVTAATVTFHMANSAAQGAATSAATAATAASTAAAAASSATGVIGAVTGAVASVGVAGQMGKHLVIFEKEKRGSPFTYLIIIGSMYLPLQEPLLELRP